ncbi:hypothetical protein PIB30_023836 [Stylosanthes scabra]|uniref:Prolamin-like domain-containing protein n=1 Tax=Stylosanthes scabra TaxID=79078 RepID=A0ABU6Q982_9FABA|nr:hypothetical protein [Stylosanthes scabra]
MGLIKKEGLLLLLLFLLMSSLACFVVFATATRDLAVVKSKQHQDLSIRISGLQGKNNNNNEEEVVNCWDSLLELKSCTNEIVLFFLNGESHLGQDCCHAIYVLTRNCWPALLTSLGFTVEETDILRGYCDAAANNSTDHDSAPAFAPLPPAK